MKPESREDAEDQEPQLMFHADVFWVVTHFSDMVGYRRFGRHI
jgi:hypothetical protein